MVCLSPGKSPLLWIPGIASWHCLHLVFIAMETYTYTYTTILNWHGVIFQVCSNDSSDSRLLSPLNKKSFFLSNLFCYSCLHFSITFAVFNPTSLCIQPVHPKGSQSWIFIGRTDAEAETPILHLMWRTDSFEKTLKLGKIEGGRRRGQRRVRWLDGLPGTQWTWVWVSFGNWWWTGKPGMLWSMGSQSRTWLRDWTELNWAYILVYKQTLMSGLPRWHSGKKTTCQCRGHGRCKRQRRSLGCEDPLEKEMATHSSILAWLIPWTEEPWATVHGVAQSWIQLSTHAE